MPFTIRLQCLPVLLAVAINEEQILLQRERRVESVHLLDVAHAHKSDTKRPCHCAVFDSAWQPPSKRLPRCIYVDLGAADGNSYKPFLEGKFGPVENCGTTENPGDFEAFLVEANPFFDVTLQQLSNTGKGKVHAMNSTAAYMCDGSTTFWLDDNAEKKLLGVQYGW